MDIITAILQGRLDITTQRHSILRGLQDRLHSLPLSLRTASLEEWYASLLGGMEQLDHLITQLVQLILQLLSTFFPPNQTQRMATMYLKAGLLLRKRGDLLESVINLTYAFKHSQERECLESHI